METVPPNADVSSSKPAEPHLDYAGADTRTHGGCVWADASFWAAMLFLPVLVAAIALELPTLLPLVAVLPFVAVGCGLAARSSERRRAQRLSGRTLIAMTFGGIELALVLLVVVTTPFMGRPREPAQRVKCGSNLRQIGQGVLLYSNDNGGRFPPDLDTIMLTQDLTFDVLVCPSTSHTRAQGATTQATLQQMHAESGHCSYVYVGGGLTQATATAEHVVAYEPMANHAGAGMNVLFGDGHVDFLAKAEAEYVLSELKAEYNPPRPRGRTRTTAP